MQAMRDVLRTTLGKSLNALQPLDRLAAAWPVAAGHGIAERSTVTALDEGVATVTVADITWQKQLRNIAQQLKGDLARISRVPLTDILFVLPSVAVPEPNAPAMPRRPAAGNRSANPGTRKPQ
jgi:predicted nucleic acid-binding Zn ribbon protein